MSPTKGTKKNRKRWFQPGRSLNWSKDDGQQKRRDNALKARRGNALRVARALQALANVTEDSETKRKARADSQYFYRLHEKNKRKKKK